MDIKFIKKIDVFLLIFFPILATVISLIFKTNLLISTLLFLGVPALYLSLRTKESILKVFAFTSLITVSVGFLIDYWGHLNNAWYTLNTVFSFRLFNLVPLENPIWAFLYIYCIIIFYEHFMEKNTHKYKNRHKVFFIFLIIVCVLTYLTVEIINPSLLKIPYWYLITGFLFLFIPTVIFLAEFPRYISKFFISASYFFFLSLLNEMTALELKQWYFPGTKFIGWVNLLNVRFPFEEFFFFIVISSVALLSYYEFFYDDRK